MGGGGGGGGGKPKKQSRNSTSAEIPITKTNQKAYMQLKAHKLLTD